MHDPMSTTTLDEDVSAAAGSAAVLGLGPMGAALAGALLRAGVRTTVWNRTPARADPLRAAGAAVAAGPGAAAADAELVVLCLRDHVAAREAVAAGGAEAFTGRTVVNLSSATPSEARRTAAWFAEHGIDYLSGAIMVPTPLVGRPEALILYSGDREVFDRHVDVLRHLGGTAEHVGADHGAASLHDVAMLEVYFAGMTAFLHAAAMVTAQGMSARDFLPFARQIAALLPETFAGLAAEVDAGRYPGTEDRLTMELAALEHIVGSSAEVGLDGSLPRVLRDLAARAVEAGHGEGSFTGVVEVLRQPSVSGMSNQSGGGEAGSS